MNHSPVPMLTPGTGARRCRFGENIRLSSYLANPLSKYQN